MSIADHQKRSAGPLILPNELYYQIFQILDDDPVTIGQLMQTTTFMRSLVNHWNPWKHLCKRLNYKSIPKADSMENISMDDENQTVVPALPQVEPRETQPPAEPQPLDPDILERPSIELGNMQLVRLANLTPEDDTISSTEAANTTLSAAPLAADLPPTTSLLDKDIPSISAQPSSENIMDWKDIFMQNWRNDLRVSRGQLKVTGSKVLFGNMSSMQTYDGKIFGAFNDAVSVWDIQTGVQIHRLTGHRETVTCIQVHDEHVVSASADRTIRLWNAETGQLIHEYFLTGVARSLRFNRREIIAGDTEGKIHILSVESGKQLDKISGHHQREITHLQFDHKFICTGSMDKVVQAYCRTSRKILFHCSEPGSFITAMTMGSNLLALGTWSGRIFAWDLSQEDSNDHLPENDSDAKREQRYSIEIKQNTIDSHFERINCVQTLPSAYMESKKRYYNHKPSDNFGSSPSSSASDPSDFSSRRFPHLLTGSNDGFIRLWIYNTWECEYQTVLKLEHEIPVLAIQVQPVEEDDDEETSQSVKLIGAGLDGRLHHWSIERWETQSLLGKNGYSYSDSECGGSPANGGSSTNSEFRSTKVRTNMTFASSFLPIVMYQDFIQVLMDNPTNNTPTMRPDPPGPTEVNEAHTLASFDELERMTLTDEETGQNQPLP